MMVALMWLFAATQEAPAVAPPETSVHAIEQAQIVAGKALYECAKEKAASIDNASLPARDVARVALDACSNHREVLRILAVRRAKADPRSIDRRTREAGLAAAAERWAGEFDAGFDKLALQDIRDWVRARRKENGDAGD
jgi:hypothetical protein